MSLRILAAILAISLHHGYASTRTVDEPLEQQVKRKAKVVTTKPEDVGLSHYKIIDNLIMNMEQSVPNNSHEILEYLAFELRDSLCDEEDYQCESDVYREVLDGMEFVENTRTHMTGYRHLKSALSGDFDQESRWVIENALDILSELDLDNVDHEGVTNVLDYELEKLQQSTSITDEEHRMVGIIALSVGIESIRQWNEISNYPEHVFFRVLMNNPGNRRLGVSFGHRRLQDELARVVRSDVLGSTMGAVVEISDGKKGNVFERTKRIIRGSIRKGVVGSVLGLIQVMIDIASCPAGATAGTFGTGPTISNAAPSSTFEFGISIPPPQPISSQQTPPSQPSQQSFADSEFTQAVVSETTVQLTAIINSTSTNSTSTNSFSVNITTGNDVTENFSPEDAAFVQNIVLETLASLTNNGTTISTNITSGNDVTSNFSPEDTTFVQNIVLETLASLTNGTIDAIVNISRTGGNS